MRKVAQLLSMAAATLVLAGCGGGGGNEGLAGTSWEVTGVNDGSGTVLDIQESTTVSVSFGSEGSLSGHGGCNQVVGSFTEDGSSLAISELGSTLLACDPDVMAQEALVLAALESASSFERDGDTLTIIDAADAVALELVTE